MSRVGRENGGDESRRDDWTRGGAGARHHLWLVLIVSASVFVLHALLPALVLSVARKPWTYFAFNPWLKSLPAYLTSSAPVTDKLDFL